MPSLSALPPGIVERIVGLLEFEDICHLRLVSREVSRKSHHGLVKSAFAAVTVVWTNPSQLQEFAAQTCSGWKGCLTKDLTIVGTAQDADNALLPVDVLADAFAHFSKHSPHQVLDSLTLAVRGPNDESGATVLLEQLGWSRCWSAAARTFEVVMLALAASGLGIRRLDIYADANQCSLACDQLSRIPDGLAPSFIGLTHLAWSLSSRVPIAGIDAADADADSSTVSGMRYGYAVRKFLNLCPSLEGFHLRWYNLGGDQRIHGLSPEDARKHNVPVMGGISAGFLDCLLPAKCLERLRSCRIRGVYTNEATLRAFLLRMTNLRDLELEELHLNGRYASVFKTMTEHLEHIENIHLDDLFENYWHIAFYGPGQPHYPTSTDNSGRPHDYSWSVKETPGRPSIPHGVVSPPAAGAAITQWRLRRAVKYGSPRELVASRRGLVVESTGRKAPRRTGPFEAYASTRTYSSNMCQTSTQ